METCYTKRMLCRSVFGLTIFPIAAIAIATPAFSQQADQRAATSETTDIVVTAQKREERLSLTPLSVSAITGKDIDKQNVTQFRDIANTLPGVNYSSSGVGQNQITIRGINTGFNVAPTVGIYIDDVPYGSSTAFGGGAQLGLDVGLFDLSRVEVLRGPQGTLYGASTMGGLIKYVTNDPDPRAFGGTARAGVSTTNGGGIGYNGSAVVNLPIVQDKVAARVSGFYSHDGGFIDDPALGRKNLDRSKVYGGRVDMLLKPTDALTVRLTGFAQNIRRDGTSAVDYTLAGKLVTGNTDQTRLKPEFFNQNFRLGSAAIAYDFGPATLTSISSYQYVRSSSQLDVSGLFSPLLGLPAGSASILPNSYTTKKFTEEVRLTSQSGGFVEWLVGGFYTHEKSIQFQRLDTFLPSGAPTGLNLLTGNFPSRYEEVAGFGDVTMHLTPKFDITGGLRYSHNDQTSKQNATGLLAGTLPERKSSDSTLTYLGNARYKFSEHVMAYARFATGYRPGGPNFVANDPVTGAPLAALTFKADTLKSYEAGFKAETADRSFAIDASGYHIDWNNLQITAVRNGIGVRANASSASIWGAELTMSARPTQGMRFVAAVGYTDARLSADTPDLGGVKGERLPNTAKVSVALTGDYSFAALGHTASLGSTIRFLSDRNSGFDGSTGLPQYRLPSYVSTDLRAGMDFGPVTANIYVRNLFDVRGQVSAETAYTLVGGPAWVTLIQPRTIGLSATARF